MKIGFTGTRHGMTLAQLTAFEVTRMTGPVISHPGKRGDCLLAMPVAKELAASLGPVLVVTSQMCAPVATLLMTLPYVRGVLVLSDDEYQVEHTHHGAYPWDMPVLTSSPDDAVFHLGFRHFPVAGQLVTHLAGEPYGITPAPGPWLLPIRVDPAGPIAIHATVGNVDTLAWMTRAAARRMRLVGTKEEVEAFDRVGHIRLIDHVEVASFLEVHAALQGCSRFVGVNSGPSIVAMGGGLPVVWPHRPGVEQERWAHEGCDVKTVDQDGTIRVLREASR